MGPWDTLGVAPDIAVADLRRRYAALIKQFRPETHPQEFAAIRAAYEVVLRHARQREAEAAENADTAAGLDARQDPAAGTAATDGAAESPVPLEPAPTQHAPHETAIAAAEPAPRPDARHPEQEPDPDDGDEPLPDEPTLAELFHHFMAAAAPATGSGDEALRPMLRLLLRVRAHSSLEDSQALEFALLRWFLEADQPALTMLFETGHAFGWHTHPERLSAWLSTPAMQRIEGLLALSRDLVFARHFSGNAWLRRLHGGHRGVVPLASRPAALEAIGWAARWRLLAGRVAPPLAACLDLSSQQRIQGFGLWSTDALFGVLAAAGLANGIGAALAVGLGAAALACALRLLARFLVHSAPMRRVLAVPRLWLRDFPAWSTATRVVVAAAALGLLALIGALAVAIADRGRDFALQCALLALAPLMLWLAWRLVGIAEVFVGSLLAWRGAVDRLEFSRLVHGHAVLAPESPPEAPYGARLSWRRRLGAIREARRLEARELLQGARPPRPRVTLNVGRGTSAWRMVWIGFWVLYGLARIAHLAGAAH